MRQLRPVYPKRDSICVYEYISIAVEFKARLHRAFVFALSIDTNDGCKRISTQKNKCTEKRKHFRSV